MMYDPEIGNNQLPARDLFLRKEAILSLGGVPSGAYELDVDSWRMGTWSRTEFRLVGGVQQWDELGGECVSQAWSSEVYGGLGPIGRGRSVMYWPYWHIPTSKREKVKEYFLLLFSFLLCGLSASTDVM